MTSTRQAAAHEPIARVLPMLTVPHLDRDFDYLVSAEQSDDAQPGTRVRVRFSGRLVDAFVLERRSDTDHDGRLGWLDRVISPEPVLTPEVRRLTEAVAARYAGTRADVLRLAIPPRHATAEKKPSPAPAELFVPPPEAEHWARYRGGDQFLTALGDGKAVRAVWQALPGESWPTRFAEAAAAACAGGRSVLAIVPDQRDVDALAAAAAQTCGADTVVALSAGLGPSQRYTRWLSVLRGSRRVVIGTRSAVFAPVGNLGLVLVWDDGEDTLAEPRAPYPHAREVAMLRAHQLRCAAVIGGFARTAEAQAMVESGWAHDLLATRETLRAASPRIVALDDDGHAQERDPAAHTARLPSMALRNARAALDRQRPVLVQVPRRGYVPALACAKCRAVARCRHCTGPLALTSGGSGATCRWCGRGDPALRCATCGSTEVRAVVVGARRTAEELGRAFPGVSVITSSAETGIAEVAEGPALVIATPGAEPRAPDGYGAALLLDGWALLGRADLRAAEDALRRWMAAAALVAPGRDGGTVTLVAEAAIPVVQALIRWDPVGHAGAELAERVALGLPPGAHMAALDGPPDAVAALLAESRLGEPEMRAEVLGPVELPAGVRRPAGLPADAEVIRMLVRVPRGRGLDLAGALRRATGVLSARREHDPVRVQIDPLRIG
ncbi:primosomal protein N' [Mycolicibacterium brumae]|uniref:Probable replication restart protein PriA n=1 Tax=Mycolicibacterium brumae TaxID=85968 RepID=A0A2G5PE60_9MYCO|nr:primosomal protein N' [Mycolicibacterium brumae]MCV7193627.1 primosomal protein N' [Mycolicibacterium brumae]PIB76194.1 primosomal protein N' [Mycolicibacterium brumae]RWA17326.1 hypothetical protein MBRU_06790 [Mycolicibacterium brumae DSM 44177]UWW09100.1 primosomal protein N' [Mycolicibacterium brumae]